MQDLELEKSYWGLCTNTVNDEIKHFTYGRLMGLELDFVWFNNVQYKNILDIGGGPAGMLLKVCNLKEGRVYDPIEWPKWVHDRYKTINTMLVCCPGEIVNETGWDEVWIYNTLQHVENPEKIIQNAKCAAKVLRIFEWIDILPHAGHPHMLTQENLERWIGQKGNVTTLTGENECYGKCFHGVFSLM